MSGVNHKDLEEDEGALLVEDNGQPPPWLNNIFASIAESPQAMEERVLALLFIIMYESGFYFLDGPQNSTISFDIRTMRSLSDPNIFFKYLRKINYQYVINFSHKLMHPDILKVVAYSVTSYTFYFPPILVLNFFSPDDKKLETVLICPETVISRNNPLEKFISFGRRQFIERIKNLLFRFKCIIGPEIYHPHHLLSLPPHILQLICSMLDARTFMKFLMTCKFLYETFFEDETLWKKYSLTEYRCLDKKSDESWKSHYMYQTKKYYRMTDYLYPSYLMDPYTSFVYWPTN